MATNFEYGLMSQGIPVLPSTQDISGSTYFVDGNSGNDSKDGTTWKKAFKTLTKAFAVSHADMARGADRWARRNTIYIAGDTFVENLVAFPQKTDIIGVGSYDANDKPGITGTHAPVNTNIGCRFINVMFVGSSAAPIVTLTGATSGCQFVNCDFKFAGKATRAILATASPFLKVKGCKISGAFVNDYINFGTGEAGGTEIRDNIMAGGADNGVILGAGTTSSYPSIIANNIIECADITLNTQATSVMLIVGNKLISGEAVGASSYVIDLTFANGNSLVGNDVCVMIPQVSAPV